MLAAAWAGKVRVQRALTRPPPPKTQSHRRHAAWERDSWRKEDGKAPKSDQAAKGKAGHDSELKSKAKDMPSTSERLLAQGVSCGGAPC